MVMKRLRPTQITPQEYQLLQDLRQRNPAQNPPKTALSLGDRLADQVAATVGSWWFIISQSCLLLLWLFLNITAYIKHWDPYPFILLNLMLSFQAAYTAPIIMMSQNRQADIDRQVANHDYEVDMKAELEIELLHDKLDSLRQEIITEILQHLQTQTGDIERMTAHLGISHAASNNAPGNTSLEQRSED